MNGGHKMRPLHNGDAVSQGGPHDVSRACRMTGTPIPRPILVLNGPNLNLLGSREPGIYGTTTLAAIEARCRELCDGLGRALRFEQSNHEGEMIEALHAMHGTGGGVALNAGAYTHTSLALHDAVRAIDAPVVEVHLSNVHAREAVRHHSMIAAACTGVVCGFGPMSYELAIRALAAELKDRR